MYLRSEVPRQNAIWTPNVYGSRCGGDPEGLERPTGTRRSVSLVWSGARLEPLRCREYRWHTVDRQALYSLPGVPEVLLAPGSPLELEGAGSGRVRTPVHAVSRGISRCHRHGRSEPHSFS